MEMGLWTAQRDRPVLSYARRMPNVRVARPPISTAFAVFLFFAFTWPFVLTLAVPLGGPTALFLGILGTVVGGFTSIVAIAFRHGSVRPLATPSKASDQLSARRWTFLILSVVLFVSAQLTGISFRLLFAAHYPLFRHALSDVAGMGPGCNAPHGRIGLFAVDRVYRGHDGEVGFSIGGDGITYDPTPATRESFFCPPDYEGRIFGDWYWTEPD